MSSAPSEFPRKTSVSVTVILAILTITTLSLITLGTIGYYHYRDREQQFLADALALDANQIAPSLALPVWNFDRPQVDKVVEGMMLDPILKGIVVHLEDGKVLCARQRDAQGKIIPSKGDFSTAGLLLEKRDIVLGDESIATVSLFGLTNSVDRKMAAIQVFIIYNILWVDLLLLLGTYWLLSSLIFKPLRKIETYAAQVSTGSETAQMTSFRGELESLRASIEKMFHLLNARYQALQNSEERIRRLVESDVQGIVFWNTHGKIFEANDAFLKIVGYTRDDLVAGHINWVKMTPPEFVEQDERIMTDLTATGVCQPYEKEFFRKDQSKVSVLLGLALLNKDSEEGVGFVLDLSERKKLEQQLLRAQRLESLGTLAGGIAHDLNNALSPILMSIALLQAKFTDSDSQELLGMLNSSAQRGTNMVKQVLSFARGVEGQRVHLQISQLINEVRKIADDTFLKNIQVRAKVAKGLWPVVGDSTQLHQVLLNLCVNARDAMPDGGLLSLSAENFSHDRHNAGLLPGADLGPYVLVQVEDTGSGMPKKVLDQIFDPFFTTKEIGKGTGLGLSTSLAIIKSHSGFIQVYSEEGQGTKFKLYLPAQPDETAVSSPLSPVELERGQGELILVIDDEIIVRQVAQRTLEAFNYRVIAAAGGKDALAIFAARSPEISVVVTDMMMPLMDGPTTIQVLRRIDPAIRIIATSGLSSPEYVERATSLGVEHFLAKPYTAELLLKTLRQVLSGG